MKNLLTRKLLFGMLMVLVLAFGVQGVADAVDDPNYSDQPLSEIVKFRRSNSTFRISVSLRKCLDLIKPFNRVTVPEDPPEDVGDTPEAVTDRSHDGNHLYRSAFLAQPGDEYHFDRSRWSSEASEQ